MAFAFTGFPRVMLISNFEARFNLAVFKAPTGNVELPSNLKSEKAN